jgi:tRNA pseudouridine55 synthase
MYSAVKVAGVPLYKSARAGKTIAREARTIIIHALDVLAIDGRDVTIRVVCSKGTYIRTLCADIGEALGVGGHLLALERCRVGPLSLDQALTVEEVETRKALGCLGENLRSLDQALQGLVGLVVDEQIAERVRHGAPVPVSRVVRWEPVGAVEPMPGQPLRIHDTAGRLLAIGRLQPTSIVVEKMLIGQE